MQLNLQRQLTTFEWLQLPDNIKSLFKTTFEIPRTGGSMVIGNKVVSDGHTNEDLSRVSLDSLQKYLDTTDDHWDRLLQLTINKMENPNVNVSTTQDNEPAPRTVEGTVNKPGRKKKSQQTA